MNEVLGWILAAIIILIIVLCIGPKRKLPETEEGKLAYKKEERKIFLKYVLPMIISLPLSSIIIFVIGYFYPNAFTQPYFDPNNIISVIISQLNNSIAIIFALASFMDKYIAVLLRQEDIENVTLWQALQGALGGYLVIIIIAINPYIRKI